MTRVLLVDDSELIRRGLRLLLSTADDVDVVGEASDGHAALDWLASTQMLPDVVLSDVKMAGMGGIELAANVAQRYPELPVILLTTFDDHDTVAAAMHAGVSGFLLKDSTTDDLISAIAAVKCGGMVLDPRITRAALSAPANPLAELTPSELNVARLVAQGATNIEIAQQLFITEGTVKNHVSALLRKLEQRDRTGLALLLSRSFGL